MWKGFMPVFFRFVMILIADTAHDSRQFSSTNTQGADKVQNNSARLFLVALDR
jgi:hypothetical protein